MGEEMKTEGDRLDVYVGSDPTNDELPPDDLFGPVDPADNPTPLQLLLYPPEAVS